MVTKPEISVIIPTRNRADTLRRCLRALENQSAPAETFEVIVVDDGSDDDVRQATEGEGGSLSLRRLFQPHRGANAARNLGASEASGATLLFLGDDMMADHRLLSAHREIHLMRPQEHIGVIGSITWAPELPTTPFRRWLEEPDVLFMFGFSGFDFDAVGNQLTMQDHTVITSYGYDADGRQIDVTDGIGKALTYSYDPVGNRTAMIDSDGGLTTYSYDPQSRLAGIANPYDEFTTIQYDALDRESERTLANGMTVNHTFDAAGRETVLGNLAPSGAALSSYTATYDPAGNRLGVLELDGSEVSYAYDPTDQLTNEQRTGANAYITTYSYDPVGNRLLKNDGGQITTCSYNAANELVLLTPPSGQPTTSVYDANGNLLTENAGGALTTYAWDFENRLIGVSSPNGVETYSYSADGMREEKENSSGTVYYVRDGDNVLIETDAGLITQAHYTDFPGVWGGLTSERRGGVSSFYSFDQQSNTRILASINGNVTDEYLYKAFGEEVSVSGATINPLLFGGQVGYWRDEAERLYVRARNLRTDMGRWMSRDPIGFDGGDWNFYGYVGENPVRFVDPNGMIFACGRKCCVKFMGDCHALWPGCCKGCKDCPPKEDKGNCIKECLKEFNGDWKELAKCEGKCLGYMVCTQTNIGCCLNPANCYCSSNIPSHCMSCLNPCAVGYPWYDASYCCGVKFECCKIFTPPEQWYDHCYVELCKCQEEAMQAL